ncbi:hypothetical protein D1B33_12245 [Lysinibacillus yapensis]|uniref:Uncharacterized protein n=2 Tax=Ureibacillus yapensis TaxID=2304605 RepID=A0A396SDH6_9BACL|nr:hypothetical protein D1B33_12245 [Lysinibacillus yapensis]
MPPRQQRQPMPPMHRQAYGAEYGPQYQARQQGHPGHQFLYENQHPQMPPHQMPPQQMHPQQMPRRRFPGDINQLMDHAGKVSEGINIMRQIGAFFNTFRG